MTLVHKEEGVNTQYIAPKGDYQTFNDDDHYVEMLKLWGLPKGKREFWYKTADYKRIVQIVGYEEFGKTDTHYTLVIKYSDGNLSCIRPDYLKEMQSASFAKKGALGESREASDTSSEEAETPAKPVPAKPKASASTVNKVQKETTKKEKQTSVDLPEDKVSMTGQVKQFAHSWNHFADRNDVVVIFENVTIDLDEPINLEYAWCSYSKTLEKQEIAVGDTLQFDGKVVKKSVPKGKDVEDEAYVLNVSVPYKINNPSKIKKAE